MFAPFKSHRTDLRAASLVQAANGANLLQLVHCAPALALHVLRLPDLLETNAAGVAGVAGRNGAGRFRRSAGCFGPLRSATPEGK